MNITVARVKKELIEYYNWELSYFDDRPEFYDSLIRDVLKVVDRKVRTKNISIRKNKPL